MKHTIQKKLEPYGIRSRILALFALLVVVPFIVLIFSVFFVFQQYSSSSYGENMVETLSAVTTQVSADIKKFEDNTMTLYHNGSVEMLPGGQDADAQNFIRASLDACSYSYSDILSTYIDCTE